MQAQMASQQTVMQLAAELQQQQQLVAKQEQRLTQVSTATPCLTVALLHGCYRSKPQLDSNSESAEPILAINAITVHTNSKFSQRSIPQQRPCSFLALLDSVLC